MLIQSDTCSYLQTSIQEFTSFLNAVSSISAITLLDNDTNLNYLGDVQVTFIDQRRNFIQNTGYVIL